MRSLPYPLAALVAVSAFGCTNDLRAPSNYLVSDDSAESSGGAMLMVDCGMSITGAVDAAFSHTPTVMGGDMNYSFNFADTDNPPPGLMINGSTGEITGAPTTEGPLEFDILVTDGSDGSGTGTCTINVNPRLSVDLEVDAPGCLSGSQTLNDVVVPGTGDNTDITCDFQNGRGDGLMPTGHAVDPMTCEITGTYQDQNFGTWVFIVRGVQSGVEVFVPYCITNDDLGDFADITVTHSGGDNTLVPRIGTFNPNAPFAIGDGAGDPHFTVEDEASCGANSCNYGFRFFYSSSNFNNTLCPGCDSGVGLDEAIIGDQLLRNEFDEPIGLEHDLRVLEGRDLPDEFRDRPWVLTLRFIYCVADNGNDCNGQNNIDANAVGRYVFSTLMFPEGT